MNFIAADILRQGNYKGTFGIRDLKEEDFIKYKDCDQVCFLIDCDYEMYMSVIIYDGDKLVIFNPTSFFGQSSQRLLESLIYLFNIKIITPSHSVEHKLVWSTCVYFLHIFTDKCFNAELLSLYFPKHATDQDHADYILDFIKCKHPKYGNSLIRKAK